MKTLAWIVAALIVLGMVFGGSDGGSDGDSGPAAGRDWRDSRDGRDGRVGSADPASDDAAATSGQPAAPSKQRRPSAPTYLVVHVVDGDTLQLRNGETVRLAGIDAPERGACGSIKATENLQRLTLGKRVRLGASDEDRDRYGRLLRYVDVGDIDAALRLIKNGFAVARYDSRDGYGRHPREARYVAADRASKDFTCARPQPLVPVIGSGCAPGYSPCIPTFPPDVDCSDVTGPVIVTGPDPHGLDADGDGVACE